MRKLALFMIVTMTLCSFLKQTPVQASLDFHKSTVQLHYEQLILLLFDLLDRDKNHLIRDPDFASLFQVLDKDCDGAVDILEFSEGMTKLIDEETRYGRLKELVDSLITP